MVHSGMSANAVPMILTNIRPAVWNSDLKHLMDIDLKCFDDPWDELDWEQLFEDKKKGFCKILIGSCLGIPTGFIVWTETAKSHGRIKRLGVRPMFRGKGVGSKLVEAVETSVLHNGGTEIFVDVTESICYQDGAQLTAWLRHREYLAAAIMSEGGVYNNQIEDLVVFVKHFTEGSLA